MGLKQSFSVQHLDDFLLFSDSPILSSMKSNLLSKCWLSFFILVVFFFSIGPIYFFLKSATSLLQFTLLCNYSIFISLNRVSKFVLYLCMRTMLTGYDHLFLWPVLFSCRCCLSCFSVCPDCFWQWLLPFKIVCRGSAQVRMNMLSSREALCLPLLVFWRVLPKPDSLLGDSLAYLHRTGWWPQQLRPQLPLYFPSSSLPTAKAAVSIVPLESGGRGAGLVILNVWSNFFKTSQLSHALGLDFCLPHSKLINQSPFVFWQGINLF